MRILFALPGFHRVNRGAEIALIAVAKHLAKTGDNVTLIGSGDPRPNEPYSYIQAPAMDRERFANFPSVPLLRSPFIYEEFTFFPGLRRNYEPNAYDVTVTCSYPFVNWALRKKRRDGTRPAHVFVTQNGDWPATSDKSEYKHFDCDALVCINPDYLERNSSRWNCALIPNGVDTQRFVRGPGAREKFGLPKDKHIILMVSALTENKRVDLGIEAIASLSDVHLVVAGHGPEREKLAAQANKQLPGRYSQVTVAPNEMPLLYQSADAFLHLTKDEPFGNVFLEAMACGLPIVAENTKRLRWIVGDQPTLFKNDGINDIASAITASLNKAADGETNGADKTQLEQFSWPVIAEKYRMLFNELTSADQLRTKTP